LQIALLLTIRQVTGDNATEKHYGSMNSSKIGEKKLPKKHSVATTLPETSTILVAIVNTVNVSKKFG